MRFASITVALFAAAASASVIARDEATPAVAPVTNELEQPFNATDVAVDEDDNPFPGEELSDDLSEEDLENMLQARNDDDGPHGLQARGRYDPPKVVFGMRYNARSKTSHWHAWKHGDDPCRSEWKHAVLNKVKDSACAWEFSLKNKGGFEIDHIKLASCAGKWGKDRLPNALKHNGKEIRRCRHKRVKHSCPVGMRDVIERGSC